MNELTKAGEKNQITNKNKVGFKPLFKRLNESKNNQAESLADAASMPNRLVLLLDCSGSMASPAEDVYSSKYNGETKIHYLREAATHFIQQCDFGNTALAIYTFGKTPEIQTPLLCDSTILQIETSGLNAEGSTPMFESLQNALDNLPLTRAVLISDGSATTRDPLDATQNYKLAEIPIDCVHIGIGSGEETMKAIAKLTGGLFIKFKDIKSFAGSFKYLTPGLRASLMLNAGEAAKILGADEVK